MNASAKTAASATLAAAAALFDMATTLAHGSSEEATPVTPEAASTAPAASTRYSRRSGSSDEYDPNDS